LDDALKIASFQAGDGVALIGYSGLGATAFGGQPSTWISNVLRGRDPKLSVEHCLGILADAMKREFEPHIRRATRNTFVHNMLISALVGKEHRVYSIDMIVDQREVRFRFTRHIHGDGLEPLMITPSLTAIGSGTAALLALPDYRRPALRLVKAFNEGRVRGETVADHLAGICYRVHQNTADGTVGPKCVVAWKDKHYGGGSQAYDALDRDRRGPMLPTISGGMDVRALVQAIAEPSFRHLTQLLERRSRAFLRRDWKCR
jgi:hypothetical protein